MSLPGNMLSTRVCPAATRMEICCSKTGRNGSPNTLGPKQSWFNVTDCMHAKLWKVGTAEPGASRLPASPQRPNKTRAAEPRSHGASKLHGNGNDATATATATAKPTPKRRRLEAELKRQKLIAAATSSTLLRSEGVGELRIVQERIIGARKVPCGRIGILVVLRKARDRRIERQHQKSGGTHSHNL